VQENPIRQLEDTIQTLLDHRAVLGDAAVDTAVAALRDKLTGLQYRSAPEQQRRQVSVMFADVVGSTVLSRCLDPEDLNAVVDGALARFTALVQAHGGQVLQYAGDNLLAVFGVPQAREDDAERAVRAGLAITTLGRELGAEVLARHGRAGFNVRVGIHSGDVLVGGGVDGANSVRGLTPNIAARMEQSAPPGGLRISQDTYRQVRGRFDLRAQPPIAVKGCDEPMVTYLVLGELDAGERQAARGVEGISTRMVGRASQFGVLQQALDGMDDAKAGALQLLGVIGDAGLGKSRLMSEFRRWARARPQPPHWLGAAATEQHMSQPYALLRSLLTVGAGLLDSDPAAVARSKWLTAVTPLLGEPAAAVLGHLLGLDFAAHEELRGLLGEPRQLRDRAFFHAGQLMRAWVARDAHPVVAVLDDLHWADDGTLDFVDHLLANHADLPLLLVVLTRPTLAERRPGWLAGLLAPPAQRIELAPLQRASAVELVDELLANLSEPAPELSTLLVDHAEGNPFHIEELINLLIDQGVIGTGDADALISDQGVSIAWQFHPERLQALKVPPTLAGVLRARLDALPEDERRLAQLASVVGYRFWDASLTALDAPPLDSLQGLVKRELAHEHEPASLAGLREYTFKHQSLHEVTYDSVLRRIRRELHARVAHWLLGLPGAAPLELVAEHFERGGQPALALDYWHRAAEAAANSYANAQALSHIERALSLAADRHVELRIQLCLLRCRVLDRIADSTMRHAALQQLGSLVTAEHRHEYRVEYLILKSRFWSDQGDEVAALAEAESAVGSAGNKISATAAAAHARHAQCIQRLGDHDLANTHAYIALDVARLAGEKRIEGLVLNDLGIQADDDGNYDKAIEYYTKALAIHQEIGDQINAAGTQNNIGYAAMTLGEYEIASRHFKETCQLFSKVGHELNHGISLINLGLTEYNQANYTAAARSGSYALKILRSKRALNYEGSALHLLGRTCFALNNHASANDYIERAISIFDSLQMHHLAMEAIATLAYMECRLGNNSSAVQYAEEVIRRMKDGIRLDGTEEPLRILLNCFHALTAVLDNRAQTLIDQAFCILAERSSRIYNPDKRQSYLTQVPFHAEIIRLHQQASR
jgi:class 3 adenylate cyclase/predicted ATPase